jgi:hypothetical protein
MSTTPTPTNTTEEKPSLINRILPGIASKKEKGGAAGPMGKSAPETSGASDQENDRRVRLYVTKIGKNKNLLQARRMHGPEDELLTVGCKDAQAFKVKAYIEAEADSDGRLYIVEEKRWLRFSK